MFLLLVDDLDRSKIDAAIVYLSKDSNIMIGSFDINICKNFRVVGTDAYGVDVDVSCESQRFIARPSFKGPRVDEAFKNHHR